MSDEPIEGQILVLTAAKASVAPTRLPELVDRAQSRLAADRERYRREYERVHADDRREAFLVEWGHWEQLGEELGMTDRERSAVRRAHEEQLLRIGRRTDREETFETALEIREPVCIGTSGANGDESDAGGGEDSDGPREDGPSDAADGDSRETTDSGMTDGDTDR
ncbi:hypothetical protein Htur_0694 [Haloterrigena turkmenica DSM 5511]|uniref:DUF8048 domain-containing protein n=1 Tax=Haloterrigena turkmenica (strain ATCC 51198 / DSM 5511 / JCM 9101 / NCIMB 13204 / VKM B-1734 / 4k) TaxID=543526 RepID=D2RWX9_HALTV|nr:hypothetical protein Htur_0694 [Haloterrigena turkmenica DSM 5511]